MCHDPGSKGSRVVFHKELSRLLMINGGGEMKDTGERRLKSEREKRTSILEETVWSDKEEGFFRSFNIYI